MKRTWVMWALCLMASCLPQLTAAQGYPNRPVKIVVPFAAGSGSDIDEFAAFIRQQLDSWRTKIAAAGIQPE